MNLYSYSRVDLYKSCPYHFKLRYVDELEEIPSTKADNPLHIGSGMHKGIEEGVEAGVKEYFSQYSIITTEHEIEALKMEYWIPKVQEWIDEEFPGFEQIHEYHVIGDNFHGYVDLILTNSDGESMIIDFKYSNNVDNYLDSEQLHIYKYYLEEEGFNIKKMGFLFIPKTGIRQKKHQNFIQFKKELMNTLDDMSLTFIPIEYDEMNVIYIQNTIREIEEAKEYPRNPKDECFTCKVIKANQQKSYHPLKRFEPPFYYDAIQKHGGDIEMALPSAERRDLEKVTKRVFWIFGAPFSGKTQFSNDFPNPLMLNTDGNIRFVDAPYVSIANQTTKTGRKTNTKLAWDVFKETLQELETEENEFQTIVIDLLEDIYEHCRFYMYDKMGLDHESDDPFKAWDKVRLEFLNTMKRVIHLDYENIIFVSHEDISKDVTKRNGNQITAIKPNLQDKVSLKVAGMVDIVARVDVNGEERKLVFNGDSYQFGGGRLDVDIEEIDLDVDELMAVYDEANKNKKEKKKREKEKLEEEVKESKKRRSRKKEEDEANDSVEVDEGSGEDSDDGTPEEEEKTTRKRRKRKTKSDDTEEKEEKSTRKRRKRKSKEEPEEDSSDDVTPPGVSSESDDEEKEEPKRKKRKSRRSSDDKSSGRRRRRKRD